jgi:hypothetical protein
MRVIVILTLLATMSLSSFSQTLKPAILIDGPDTLLGFNRTQAQTIAKFILKAQAYDTLAKACELSLSGCDTAISHKKQQIANLERIVEAQELLGDNYKKEINLRIEEGKALKKQVKREKWQKRGLALICIILGVLAIK